MKDNRLSVLAENIVSYSIDVQKGEKVYIEALDTSSDIVNELIKAIYNRGGYPFPVISSQKVQRAILSGVNKEYCDYLAKYRGEMVKDMDACIFLRGGVNSFELSDTDSKRLGDYTKYFGQPIRKIRNDKNVKWVLLNWANESQAQLFSMPTEAFEDFYFKVCNLDYKKMGERMTPLKELMDKTDRVRIVGKGTDLSFSIKGIGSRKCCGLRNIPDGEIYSAPVKNSVNGTLCYNIPSIHAGFKYEDIRFVFKDGKIIEATANNSQKLNTVLDTDEGARYIGEFSLGLNPYVIAPSGDILFDEKMAGSFHFTPGDCYKEASNTNSSAIHWDLICCQTPEYGGGEIYFDDVLIRKDGRFVTKELECLNPENLK